MNKYVENIMKEYVRNMKEYVENVKNMKKYVNIYVIWHSHIYIGHGTWKNSEHRLHIVSGTWKNFEFSLFIWALGLGKILRLSFLLGSGTWKNFDLHPYIYIGFKEIGSGT